jgi:hypothetical protein
MGSNSGRRLSAPTARLRLHGLQVALGTTPTNDFGLVQPDYRLGQRVVVGIASLKGAQWPTMEKGGQQSACRCTLWMTIKLVRDRGAVGLAVPAAGRMLAGVVIGPCAVRCNPRSGQHLAPSQA